MKVVVFGASGTIGGRCWTSWRARTMLWRSRVTSRLRGGRHLEDSGRDRA